ncbi:MAG: diaminopimelate epimerase [Gammaproteobacteria bacterium]|nr:diaminopimelate epimerase [Gammaproteobacteria bacterium]|tara:strand:+ start:28964 stop:29797 length:834 start_codon:yes stop_codon:yes gene_type:complete
MSNKLGLKLNKFSGLGNKIVLVDLIRQDHQIDSRLVLKLSKQYAIDFDQLISILPPRKTDMDFSAEIFNADGSKAKNCINGARCLGKYIFDTQLSVKPKLFIETGESDWIISPVKKNIYRVFQKRPNLNQREVILPKKNPKGLYELTLFDKSLEISFINIGNPHAVVFTSNIKEFKLDEWGQQLQQSKYFPKGVNLGVAEKKSNSKLSLRVYERGVGETLSCGSGACAAVIAGIKLGILKGSIQVDFKEGSLNIKYNEFEDSITVEGSANFIEEMEI